MKQSFKDFCLSKYGFWFGDPMPEKPYLFSDFANALSAYLEGTSE